MPRNNFLWCIVFLFVLFFLSACEGDVASLDEDEFGSLDTAAIAVSVEWPDEAGTAEDCDAAGIFDEEDAYGARMSAAPVTLSDNCADRGVDKVRVEVRSSSGSTLKSATFDCSAGQGTLRGVKPQSGSAIVVSGLNSGGTAIYRGSKTDVTLHAGMNNVGRIQVEPLYTTQYNVTASAGKGGSVSPSSRSVDSGSTASFTVSANSGYTRNTAVGGTCPSGPWSGSTYRTGAVSGDCSVSFSFSQSEPSDETFEFDDVIIVSDLQTNQAGDGNYKFKFALEGTIKFAAINEFSAGDAVEFQPGNDNVSYVGVDGDSLEIMFGELSGPDGAWFVTFRGLGADLLNDVDGKATIDDKLNVLNTYWDWDADNSWFLVEE